MSNDNAATSAGDAPGQNNTIDNVRNVLGFLLAGFGAILSFLGVRSSEVTTVLRNDTLQASLIALILLLGVLAAVSAVATSSKQRVVLPAVVAIGCSLVGLAALVVFFIPIDAALITVSGAISLAVGCILIVAGMGTLIFYRPFWADQGVGQGKGKGKSAGTGRPGQDEAQGGRKASSNRTIGKRGWQKQWPESTLKRSMQIVDVLLLAGVLLLGIAVYGAMRLETKSQLSFSAQVGAVFSLNGSIATASVDIAATKIAQSDWVFVDVYGLPAGIDLSYECMQLYQDFTIPSNSAPCTSDPCLYFSQQKYSSKLNVSCVALLNGSILPNASGDVDETLTAPFLAAKYQDVDVRAEVCSLSLKGCEGSPIGQNSRLDWVVPNASNNPG